MAKAQVDSLQEGQQALLNVDETVTKGAAKNYMGVYNTKSTILLGFDGDKCVSQEFYIHEEAAKILFPEFRILDPASRIDLDFKYVPKTPVAGAIVPEKRDGDATKREARGRVGRVFAGRKVKIPIPLSLRASMKPYFGKGNRKTISLIFPPLASTTCIAVWIATHCETNKLEDFSHFWMPSGIKHFVEPKHNTADPTALKALLGTWGTKFRNRLEGTAIAPNT